LPYDPFSDEKTEMMVLSRRNRILQFQNLTLRIGASTITASKSVRNLGMIMDNMLNMENHVNMLTQSAYMKVRNIYHIRKYLTKEAAKSAIQALVINKLDYGNSLTIWYVKITFIQTSENTKYSCPHYISSTGGKTLHRG